MPELYATNAYIHDLMAFDWGVIDSSKQLTSQVAELSESINPYVILGEEKSPNNSNGTSYCDNHGVKTEPKSSGKNSHHTYDNITSRFITFMQDVFDNPSASLTEHYKNIGIKGTPADNLRDELMERGWILFKKGKSTAKGGAPPKIVSLTKKGLEFYNAFNNRQRKRNTNS